MVDRLLKQLPHADPTLSGRDPTAKPASPPPPPPPPRPVQRPPTRPRRVGGAWSRAALGVVASGALPFWPYDRSCGLGVGMYLAACVVVIVTGLWAAGFAWRERVGAAHVLALLAIGAGLVLGAERVLPRVGYARAEASWSCTAPPPAPTPTVAPMIVTDTAMAADSEPQ